VFLRHEGAIGSDAALLLDGARLSHGGVSPDTFSLWRAFLNSDRMENGNVIDVRVRQIGYRMLRLRKQGHAFSVVDSFSNALHVLPGDMVPQNASTILDLGIGWNGPV
jgi:hypothetical protein